MKGGLDGTIGVRSARLIEDYSDMPGHSGVDGDYKNSIAIMDRMIQVGFQINIHAIGDRANRDSLEFYERNFKINPDLVKLRHRIEHASIIHPDDYIKFANLKIIASVQPPYVSSNHSCRSASRGVIRVARLAENSVAVRATRARVSVRPM